MINIDNVVPRKDTVIVQLLNLEETFNGLITRNVSDEQSIATRYGKVISKGPQVNETEHCPDLEVGEISVFTEFAGHFIPTEKDIYKAIRGYDIIGKYMKEDDIENKDRIIPTGDRVLVEVLDLTKTSDGLLINNDDPRISALSFGKILKVNENMNASKLKKDQIVAFPPYVGTTIRNYESDDKKELKVIVEFDILFTA